ncbi:hypothetical protein B0J13DRAFT_572117 [Dactylonectria estremocensis]|uniref:Wac domain-containing protein n=1 Tax=Dactylonectria estremocensis TaxID=1079267 RepID=A0A9P9DAI7_9HYPO|nr:hypothetical protein B0J13DRAFT_572117 [Dactylonectria estremocensis]
MDSTTVYLTREEYIDGRNRQEELLTKELRSFRNATEDQFAALTTNLGSFRESTNHEINCLKYDIHAFIDGFRTSINELALETTRLRAFTKNNNLHNPTLRLEPIPSISNGAIIHPDMNLYPKNAREFYSLRKCDSETKRKTLAHLIQFYDLPYDLPCETQSADAPLTNNKLSRSGTSQTDSSSTSGSDDSEAIFNTEVDDHSQLAVDALESILGLNPQHFKGFLRRASKHRRQQAKLAKRRRTTTLDDSPRKRTGQTLELRPRGQYAREDDDKSGSTKLGWDQGPSPSVNARIRRTVARERDKELSIGTTTNRFTSTPESVRTT